MFGLSYELTHSISYAHPFQPTWDGDNPKIPTPLSAGGTAVAINDSQRHEMDPNTQNRMLVDVVPQVENQDAMEVDTQESARLQGDQDPMPINELDTGEANDFVDMPFEGVDAAEVDALVIFIR